MSGRSEKLVEGRGRFRRPGPAVEVFPPCYPILSVNEYDILIVKSFKGPEPLLSSREIVMLTSRHLKVMWVCLALLLWARGAMAQESLSRLVKAVQPAVVTVITYNSQGKQHGIGSGFFINQEGHVITNQHVIREARRIIVKTMDGQSHPVKSILAEDRAWDVALLAVQIPPGRVRPLKISPVLPEIGDRIIVVGSPLGLDQTISDGLVSGLRPLKGGSHILQISAPISRGSSGGPVMNMKGEVVGIATFMISGGQNLNFAIPGSRLLALKPGASRMLGEAKSGPEPETYTGGASLAGLKKRGHDYFKAGDYDRAIAEFSRALQYSPGDSQLYYSRGTAYALKGQYPQALLDLNRCLEIDPRGVQALNNRGIVYARQGQYARALVDYNRALTLDRAYAHAYYNKGIALEKLGRNQEAVTAYRSFLKYASPQSRQQIQKARERIRALGGS